MANKQTAVEWLEDHLELVSSGHVKIGDLIKQAKQMEKEQIEEALLMGLVLWDVDKPRELYYNETFKSE
jgi:hypothetical protein